MPDTAQTAASKSYLQQNRPGLSCRLQSGTCGLCNDPWPHGHPTNPFVLSACTRKPLWLGVAGKERDNVMTAGYHFSCCWLPTVEASALGNCITEVGTCNDCWPRCKPTFHVVGLPAVEAPITAAQHIDAAAAHGGGRGHLPSPHNLVVQPVVSLPALTSTSH